ncbi:MAG TPA: CBS domain-containing protein [Bacillota bacterium]|nr:CBS domain-containing protein [Bacillota bacterium]
MKVSDLLKEKGQNVVTITPNQTVNDALKMLLDHKIGSLMVMDTGNQIKGIITERDIIRGIAKDFEALKSLKVADLMSTSLIVGTPDDEIEYIMGIMTQNRIRHLPIVTNQGLVGMVSIGDLVKSLLQENEVKNRFLEDYISGNYFGW